MAGTKLNRIAVFKACAVSISLDGTKKDLRNDENKEGYQR